MGIHQSVFGIEAPRFVVSSTPVDLDYWIVLQDQPEDNDLRAQSVLTQHRAYTDIGDHWILQGFLLLTYYDDPYEKWQDLLSYERSSVDSLYRRRDRQPFKNSSGTVVKFRLKSIIPQWFDAPYFPDKLLITFESIDLVDKSYMTNGNYLLEPDGVTPVLDPDGNRVLEPF